LLGATAIAAVCVAIVTAVYLRHRNKNPIITATLPAVNLDGKDPQIASLIERATTAVKLAPRSGNAWGTLGAALIAHKFEKEAVVCFAEAERLQPQEPRWPYLHGLALRNGDPDSALQKLTRAAQLTPDSMPTPRLRVADLLIERGRLDEAEGYLQAVLEKHPAHPHAQLGMGKIELARGNLAEALKRLEKLTDDPQTARASTALIATIHQRMGNDAAADEASKRVSTMGADAALVDPFLDETATLKSGMQAWLTQADRLRKNGQLTEAIALFEKAVATYRDSPIAWQLLGQAYLDQKNYRAAEKALLKAVHLAPDLAEAHFQLGSAFYLQELPRRAAECFQRSVELRPIYAPGYYNLGLALSAAGLQSQAVEAFQTAIRYEPQAAPIHRQLGAALALDGRFKEAVESLQRAVELDPADTEAARMLERAKVHFAEQP